MEKIRVTIPPLYADEVNIEAGMKFDIDKDKKGKNLITKSAYIQLLFWDKISQMVISRINLDVVTAKKLADMLKKQVEKVMEEVHKKGVPEAVKRQMEQQKETKTNQKKSSDNYFG